MPHHQAKKTFFIDTLCLSTLCTTLLHGGMNLLLRVYDRTTPLAQQVINILNALGARIDAERIPYFFDEIRDANGRCLYRDTLRDAFDMLQSITREELATDGLVVRLARQWSHEKIQLHLFNQLREPIRLECLRIVMTRWIVDHESGLPAQGGDPVLLTTGKSWRHWLGQYAKAKRVDVRFHGSIFLELSPCSILSRHGSMFCSRLKAAWIRYGTESPAEKSAPSASTPRPPLSATGRSIAVLYGHREMRFREGERTEFFWLNKADIPKTSLLWLGYVQWDGGADCAEAQRQGILVYGAGGGAQHYRPTWQERLQSMRIAVCFLWEVMAALASTEGFRPAYALSLFTLCRGIAYWRRFYTAHGVRVQISPNSNGTVAQVLALDGLGALSIAYQYSVAAFNGPFSVNSNGESIQCVFSREYENLWRAQTTTIRAFADTGYIDDDSLQRARPSDEPPVQQTIRSAGASFVITFFDENTRDTWAMHGPNRTTCSDYAFLFEWLLSDLTLGLILKPKVSSTILERLSPIRPLMDAAMRTGRCRIILSEGLVGGVPPTAAAKGSDLCIGLLLGATATLEAALLGIPSLLLDHEKNEGHRFYTWFADRVMFHRWEDARKAVEAYRAGAPGSGRLGDWTGAIDCIDPFRDGQAAQRIAFLVSHSMTLLESGKSPDETLRLIQQRFQQRWGSEHMRLREMQPDTSPCPENAPTRHQPSSLPGHE